MLPKYYSSAVLCQYHLQKNPKTQQQKKSIWNSGEWLSTQAITFTVTHAIFSPLYSILLDYLHWAQKHTRDSPSPLWEELKSKVVFFWEITTIVTIPLKFFLFKMLKFSGNCRSSSQDLCGQQIAFNTYGNYCCYFKRFFF